MSSNLRPPASIEPTLEDFRNSGWDAGRPNPADYFQWAHLLAKKAVDAFSAGELPKARLLWLLADACNLRLTPEKYNEPLRPTGVDEYGQPRGLATFEAHAGLLAEIYPLIDEPLLKARLADIAWLARRPKRNVADAMSAINAYRLAPLDEAHWFTHDGEGSWRRGITLAAQLRSAGEVHWREMGDALRQRIEAGLAPAGDGATAISMCRVLLDLGIGGDRYITMAELLVQRGERLHAEGQFFQARHHYSAARHFFTSLQDEERRADMAVLAAATHVGEAMQRTSGPNSSFSAATDMYTDALHELYSIPKPMRAARNVEPELRRIYGLVRECGARAMDEFVPFHHEPIDVKDEVEATIRAVADLPFVEALRVLADVIPYTSRAHAEASARAAARRFSFIRLFSATHIASDGRNVQRTPAVDALSESDMLPPALLAHMVRDHQFRVRFVTTTSILPALQQIVLDHLVDEKDLFNICMQSALVPRNRAPLVAKGLKAGFDFDFPAALHLLIPQLENFVRVHLSRRGVRTATLEQDGVLMELGLSTLAAMPEMNEVFGPDLAFEIQALFCEKSGPNLRNDLAHGLLEYGPTQSAESIYAWWLIFKMVFCNYWLTNGQLPPDETRVEGSNIPPEQEQKG